MMLSYCPTNQSLMQPWINEGLNRCFTETITTTIYMKLLISLTIATFVQKKKCVRLASNLQSHSKLLYLQYFLFIFIPFIFIIRVFVFALTNASEELYGFMIYELSVITLTWLFALYSTVSDTRMVYRTKLKQRYSAHIWIFWSLSWLIAFLPLVSVKSVDWWWRLDSASSITELVLWLIYLLSISTMLVIGFFAPGMPSQDALRYLTLDDDLEQPLLSGDLTPPPAASGHWAKRFRQFRVIFQFIWPAGKWFIRLRVICCFVLFVLERVINLFTPVFYKRVVDSLTESKVNRTLLTLASESYGRSGKATPVTTINGTSVWDSAAASNEYPGVWPWWHHMFDRMIGETGLVYRWDYVLEYIGIRFLQGLGGTGGGLIGAVRSQLWINVDQNATRELSIMLFAHLQNLSLNWHVSRKTGEMLRIVDRGTSSITSVLSYMVFNIGPTFLDLIIGVVYFTAVFNFWYGLIVFLTMSVYLATTMLITEWRTVIRRQMNDRDNEKRTKAVDALLNYETVKYFTAERFEVDRYREAFVSYQQVEWKTTATLNVLNTVQNLTITLGVLAGTLLCTKDVVLGRLSVGDFVLFCTYVTQLYNPLGYFGTYYRLLQSSIVDMENMFDLLDQETDVADDPDALDLEVKGGKIVFDNVSFHYTPEKQILKNLSFVVPPGRTVALVGASGAGKSTVVRLLFRFYDVTGGHIRIDDQDIARVTQMSLRKAIGVVPQDTVLFNDTIQYNIRYGRFDASDAEIEEAAMNADIHNILLGFPMGYQTLVGERGLKLSGGERQRVAIARNLLKNPSIVMLDEATSALDTTTERVIQASLNRIAQSRTTLIVAHRLSTIVHADEILVMDRGEIVERGTHDQLLAQPDSRYAVLWNQQIQSSESGLSKGERPTDESQ